MTINAIDKSVQLINCYDGNLYSRYPLGDLPGLALHVVASGWDQSVSNSGTITGPAPFGVMFNATRTVSGEKNSFNEVGYHWDFGYSATANAGSFRYGNNTNKANYLGGPVVGHVFKTPGTFNVTVRGDDGSHTADRTITVIVQDPNTVYAGASTILYSTDGSDDQATYPGATPRTWSTTMTAAVNTRYLFKKGQTFGSSIVIPVVNNFSSATATPVSGVLIGEWGSATDAPVFTAGTGVNIAAGLSSSSGNLYPGFPYNISVKGLKAQVQCTYFASDITVVDCDMRGKPVTNFGSSADDTFGSLHDNDTGLLNQVWRNPKNIFIQDNDLSGTANSAAQTFFMYGHNIHFAGNYVSECKEHGIRVKACYVGNFRNNYVTGYNDPAFTGKTNLTVRAQQISAASVDTSTTASIVQSGAWYPTRIMMAGDETNGNLSTRYVIVDNNVLGATDWTGNNWYATGPEFFNALVIFNIQDTLFQRNKIYPGADAIANNSRPIHAWGGIRTTFRNNDYYSLSASSTRSNPRVSIRTSYTGSDNPGQTSADYVPVYINTSTDGTSTDLVTEKVIEAPALITPRKAGS